MHKQGHRQGLGSDAATERALDLAMIDRNAPLKVADIGCGTGASTIQLARLLNKSRITAVDFLYDFLDVLREEANSSGVAERISMLTCSMDSLPFADEELDLIWSEGAIYNIGFEKGVTEWRRFIKMGGLLVASEITLLTDVRPKELQHHWDNEYPEINTASAKISILENHGYSPPLLWLFRAARALLAGREYYRPMQARFDDFLVRNGNCKQAREIVDAEQAEIELYKKYKTHIREGLDNPGHEPDHCMRLMSLA